jgi:DnaJ-domain-containing protein 1
MREDLFPTEMERRRREKEENQRRQDEYRRWNDPFGGFDPFARFSFLSSLFFNSIVPKESFEFLGLTIDATKDDVKSKFRELSKIHHPDKGGNNDKFVELTEAKNKCLAYIK